MTWRFASAIGIVALCVSFAGCTKKPIASSKPVPVPAATNQPAEDRPAARMQPQRSTPRETASTPTQSRMPDEATKLRIQDLLNRIQDAYFDYDKHEIRADAQKTLQADANTLTDILHQFPDYKLTVQGYCDERGSAEYNIGLGDARAKKAKEYLVSLGIPAPQLLTISYGKERPVCTDANEDCWQKNRRAHITQEQGSR